MKKMMLILGTVLIGFSSCKKNLPDPGATASEKIANEWWVELTDNGSDLFGIGHFKLTTYNTSDNNNQIWVDDFKNGYGFKVKADANYNDLSFAATTAANQYYLSTSPASFPQAVTITNGKVIPGAGRSKTGNVTDSIYMQIKFSDFGTTLTMSGHARTRFAEDEY